MKHLILMLSVTLSSLSIYAQAADSYLSTSYVGYTAGKHRVKVKNLQNCAVQLQLKYSGNVTSVSPNPNNNVEYNMVGANQEIVYEITGAPSLSIQVKALSICEWKGVMPIWVNPLDNMLPVKFKSVKATQLNSSQIKVVFEVEEEINIDHYNIQINDGKGFKNYAVLFPGEYIKPGTYSTIINIKNNKQ